jgi:hypothetical protein
MQHNTTMQRTGRRTVQNELPVRSENLLRFHTIRVDYIIFRFLRYIIPDTSSDRIVRRLHNDNEKTKHCFY